MTEDFTMDEDIATFALGDKNTSGDLVDALEKQTLNDKDSKKPKTQTKTFKKRPITVAPLKANAPFVSTTISPANIVAFKGKEDYLSTFYKSEIEIGGIYYPSVEQYYQATKIYSLCGPHAASRLQTCRFPHEAKSRAKEILRRGNVSFRNVEAWKASQGVSVLLYANALKFLQNPKLMDKLRETGDKLLVQVYEGDNLYACGMNAEDLTKWAKENEGKTLNYPYHLKADTITMFPVIGEGRNLSGMVLMKVRSVLKDYPKEQLKDKATQAAILAKIIN
ncbi:unnamed protein product [Bursaphelenchus xylophilus]|uniref:(pine wood nematode) hypothetical protein n=1 Tax=Bursaphelenchus xylophilus TaxID=6326 RepID=A0A1I7S9T5_BURXY|nr:unnamed protein product [Bursaphelenchus xylophilus]CAG9129224.1 unnamed protein product [Bursaphelenchus xylophilus]